MMGDDGMVGMVLNENCKFLRFFFFPKRKGYVCDKKKIKIENLGCTGSPDVETGSKANLVTSQS